MKSISAIVIDDEANNRQLITTLIKKLNPNFTIKGEAKNIDEAFEIINALKPDVIFLDIKMPDGNGFELLKRFSTIDFEVVFVTGFDEYALKAFEFNVLDYVLKPIDFEKFTNTLNKVQARIEKNILNLINLEELIQTYDTGNAIITKIKVHHNNKVILLPVSSIVSIQASEGNTVFCNQAGEKYISAKQLSDFEFIISSFLYFIRVSKSTYVNVNYIVSYSKGAECYLTMKDTSRIEVSKRKKAEILDLLESNR